jgi:uncharacterized protein (TIGR02569 family)
MREQAAGPPAVHIVEAFGGDAARLIKLAGGQNTSWRAGAVALKPTAPDGRVGWLGRALAQVPDTEDFRLARPVPATDGRWIVEGWSATARLEGVHAPDRCDDALRVSTALHTALARVHAGSLPVSNDPWSVGMRAAWGGELPPSGHPGVVSVLEELSPLLEQPWEGPPPQLIHGDLGGNILYADGLPPAVIDVSPHLAPAAFANAIIVADGVAWEGAPAELATRFAATSNSGAQLLARAVVYRILAMVGLARDRQRVLGEIAGYRLVVDVALGHRWSA